MFLFLVSSIDFVLYSLCTCVWNLHYIAKCAYGTVSYHCSLYTVCHLSNQSIASSHRHTRQYIFVFVLPHLCGSFVDKREQACIFISWKSIQVETVNNLIFFLPFFFFVLLFLFTLFHSILHLECISVSSSFFFFFFFECKWMCEWVSEMWDSSIHSTVHVYINCVNIKLGKKNKIKWKWCDHINDEISFMRLEFVKLNESELHTTYVYIDLMGPQTILSD